MAANYIVAGTVGRAMKELMASMVKHIIERDDDPITQGIVTNSSAVEMVTQLGRPPAGTETDSYEFQAIHPVSFGRAGTIEYRPLAGLLNTDGPPTLSKGTAYPSASDAPQRTTHWMKIGLKWLVGNITIERRQQLALASGNMVENLLAEWVRDPVLTIHQQMTNDFLGKGYGICALVASAGGATIAAGAEGTITIARNVRPFWRGQRLEIWETSGGAPTTVQIGGSWSVTKVHSFETGHKLTVRNNSGSSATIAATNALTLKGAWSGTVASAVLGLQHFTDNTLEIHALSKSTHPELRSYNDAPGTARHPTPDVFQLAFDAMYDRGFKAPNRVATTRGVRSLYYRNEGHYKSYNTDLANTAQRGADGGLSGNMQFTTEREVVTFEISPFVPKGLALPYRTDVLVRYCPEGLNAIRFVGEDPLLGSNMFLPSLDGDGNYTTVKEAPFDFFAEFGCKEPQCLGYIADLKELADVVTG